MVTTFYGNGQDASSITKNPEIQVVDSLQCQTHQNIRSSVHPSLYPFMYQLNCRNLLLSVGTTIFDAQTAASRFTIIINLALTEGQLHRPLLGRTGTEHNRARHDVVHATPLRSSCKILLGVSHHVIIYLCSAHLLRHVCMSSSDAAVCFHQQITHHNISETISSHYPRKVVTKP